MKIKRIISLLLCAVMVLALMPFGALAKHSYYSRVIVDAPALGKKPATEATSQNNKGPNPDLFVTIVTVDGWSGELDANGCFKAGVAYTVTVTERISEKSDSDFYPDKSKMNGKNSTLVSISDDKRSITTSYTFAPLQSQTEQDPEQTDKEEAALALKRSRFYTQAKADAAFWELNQGELILDGSQTGNYYSKLTADQVSNITRLLLDYEGANADHLHGTWTARFTDCFQNIREVWLSPKVDAKAFISELQNAKTYVNSVYERYSGGIMNGKCTIYVPESQLPKGLLSYSSNPISPVYSVKVYSGDVYEAYKQGASAGRDWCPGHDYTGKIQTASRMKQYISCQQPNLWYYSCKWCGKCEYNPNHTFSLTMGGEDGSKTFFPSHDMSLYDLSPENYIGTNERGEKVYCRSCSWCGINSRDLDLSYTYAQYLSDNGLPNNADSRASYNLFIAQTKKNWEAGGATYNAAMKATADSNSSPKAFAVRGGWDVTAKTSPWASNEVAWATVKGLIDQSLLGSDYTAAVNRLQFCSVVVRMAEKLTFKSITPAPADSFTDTDNQYILKAVTAGITNGMGDGTFNPDGILNRQQMATFIYRALMYVKNNSTARYTPYESKLGNYSDSGQLADWAREAMAFMNALGLIKGTSDTQLSPNANCTIEQAILAAYRSLSAEDIGWYQSLGGTESKDGGTGSGGNPLKFCFFSVPGGFAGGDDSWVQLSYRQSERFWVTGTAASKSNTLAITDPYTGDTLYVEADNFRPIKAD